MALRSFGGVRQWWRWLAALLGTREGLGSALYWPGRRGRSSWGNFAGEDGAGGGDRDGVGACQGTATAVDVVASRSASGGGAWQLDAEPGGSGLGELVLGEVRS